MSPKSFYYPAPPPQPGGDELILEYDLNLATPSTTLEIPLFFNNDFTVDWGDGSPPEDFVNVNMISHTYASLGIYDLAFSGSMIGTINYNFGGTSKDKLINIKQWGNIAWAGMGRSFSGCANLGVCDATDSPNISGVSDFSFVFSNCFNLQIDVSGWDVSAATSMVQMFKSCYVFNSDLSSWDVSNVVSFGEMFAAAYAFNGNITTWNLASANECISMFFSAESLNQDLSGWSLPVATDLRNMFFGCIAFNSDLNNFDVSNVQNMQNMFNGCTAFNGDITNWNTDSATNMIAMFFNCVNFNQDLSGWCVENIATEPTDFANNTPAWVLPKPNWGAPCL